MNSPIFEWLMEIGAFNGNKFRLRVAVQCTGGLKPGCHEDCQHREAHEVYRGCKGCEPHICPNVGAEVNCEPVKRPMGVK